MKKRLQAVLDRVKEPETNLSLADLGLVERIRYLPRRKKLKVFLNPVRPAPACCSIMSGLILNTTLKNLAGALREEFPELAVELPHHDD